MNWICLFIHFSYVFFLYLYITSYTSGAFFGIWIDVYVYFYLTLFYRYIFLAIYSCEMVIKVIAKGFVLNKYTYLRNPWNWLDFVVITSGYATIGMEVGNLAGLRTFRVLRALKTVSIMPGKFIIQMSVKLTIKKNNVYRYELDLTSWTLFFISTHHGR